MSIILHPLVEERVNEFRSQGTGIHGVTAEELVEDVVYDHFNMQHCFFAVAAKIRVLVDDKFLLGKQTGVLIGGNDVEIASGELIVQGDKRSPVQIIAINSLTITAPHISASDVSIYVLPDTMLKVDPGLLDGCRVKLIVVSSEYSKKK